MKSNHYAFCFKRNGKETMTIDHMKDYSRTI